MLFYSVSLISSCVILLNDYLPNVSALIMSQFGILLIQILIPLKITTDHNEFVENFNILLMFKLIILSIFSTINLSIV